jgi:hypothetical protein
MVWTVTLWPWHSYRWSLWTVPRTSHYLSMEFRGNELRSGSEHSVIDLAVVSRCVFCQLFGRRSNLITKHNISVVSTKPTRAPYTRNEDHREYKFVSQSNIPGNNKGLGVLVGNLAWYPASQGQSRGCGQFSSLIVAIYPKIWDQTGRCRMMNGTGVPFWCKITIVRIDRNANKSLHRCYNVNAAALFDHWLRSRQWHAIRNKAWKAWTIRFIDFEFLITHEDESLCDLHFREITMRRIMGCDATQCKWMTTLNFSILTGYSQVWYNADAMWLVSIVWMFR